MSTSPEAQRLLDSRVRAFYLSDRSASHATGRVVGYCEAPMVLIETEDGDKIYWRADLCEQLPEPSLLDVAEEVLEIVCQEGRYDPQTNTLDYGKGDLYWAMHNLKRSIERARGRHD